MNPTSHRLLRAYLSRRSPWGPPWWIYGVAFGAANLVRQALIIASPVEISAPARVASWAATALLVIAVVNMTAVVLRRLPARRDGDTAPVCEVVRLSAERPEEKAA